MANILCTYIIFERGFKVKINIPRPHAHLPGISTCQECKMVQIHGEKAYRDQLPFELGLLDSKSIPSALMLQFRHPVHSLKVPHEQSQGVQF